MRQINSAATFMSNRKPYNDIIMDHIRNVRNYRVMNNPSHQGEAVNALCGDTFGVYLRMREDVIDEISFQCECCGISMASASVMSEWLRGKRRADALATKAAFVTAISARAESLAGDLHPDSLALLQQVRATPGRDGCAVLAWSALESALAPNNNS